MWANTKPITALSLPLVKDFKIESAVFPAENQPKISSAETQAETNSASRISAEKNVLAGVWL